MKILFIQHELFTWERAKMWGYIWHLGIEEGLAANNVEFTTLVTPWFPLAKELCAGKTFDQVWINDITHMFEPGGCGGQQLHEEDLEWIASLAPVRLGFLVESLEYTKEEHESNPYLKHARSMLEKTCRYMTHIMAPDEKDVPFIRNLHAIPVSWFLCPIPERYIRREITLPPQRKPTFRGTPYGERARWLELPELKGLINNEPSPDNLTNLSKLFDELQELAKKTIAVSDYAFYDQYLQALRRIRRQAFEPYLKSMEEGCAVVNFPSFGKTYTGRVYEGMAAGRPVITVENVERPQLDALFDVNKDILLYPRDDPSMLAEHIKHILREPEFGQQIAINAGEKLLKFHTTEKRVRQFLDWIETGKEPFVEIESSSPKIPLNPPFPKGEARALPPLTKGGGGDFQKNSIRTGKLRILLISPPYARFLGLGNCRFPQSFGNMAAMLSMNNHDVAIYDADFDKNLIGKSNTYEYTFSNQKKISDALQDKNHSVWKEIEQQVRKVGPDVVGITTMTSKFPMAVRIAEIAKSINPHIKVVIGGHHASIFGPKLVQDKNIDFAVIGEGEMTFMELANRMRDPRPDFAHINGLAYKNGKGVVVNEPRELLCNLDALPMADRDLMINENYVSENNIMTSRGCPFNCSYCGAQVIWKRKVRRRSVQSVAKEIEYLLKRSPSRVINFWDDSFTSDRAYTKELMHELKKFDGLRFSCITRLDLVDKETLMHLKEAGCSMILFGIESGNNDILKLIDKKMTREFIKKQTALVDSVNIPWLGFFIMGYPGETKENILQTLAFMKELNPSFAEINIFNPLPGTKIWNDLEQKGRVSGDMDFSHYSQSSTENYFTQGNMTKQEFQDLALYMAREFDKHNRSRNGK